MSEEEKRTQKQNYLRSEIIEKGYEPGEFAQFLEDERENGKKNSKLTETGIRR